MRSSAMWKKQIICSIYIISFVQWVYSVELTFDLPDSSHDCFHQDIEKNRSATLEFQVINTNYVINVLFMCVCVQIVGQSNSIRNLVEKNDTLKTIQLPEPKLFLSATIAYTHAETYT